MRFILLSAGIFVLETFIKQKREENTQTNGIIPCGRAKNGGRMSKERF